MDKGLPISTFVYSDPNELSSSNNQLCKSEGYIFSLIRKGSGSLRIGHSSLKLSDFILVNIRPNTTMEWQFNVQPFVSSVLIIHIDSIDDPNLLKALRSYDCIHLNESPLIKLNKESFDKLNQLIVVIALFQDNLSTVEHLVKGFLTYIVKTFTQPKFQQLNDDENFSFQFINLVRENYAKQKSLSYYANELKVSTQVLRNRVKMYLNDTPNKIIWNITIDKAKELLTYANLTISEVAYQIGCDDVAYFSRKFKRVTRLSPSSYRDKYRKIQ
ncbi:MAG: helix-turn-helix domain-containing protein [Thermonemataceae bacterium]